MFEHLPQREGLQGGDNGVIVTWRGGAEGPDPESGGFTAEKREYPISWAINQQMDLGPDWEYRLDTAPEHRKKGFSHLRLALPFFLVSRGELNQNWSRGKKIGGPAGKGHNLISQLRYYR